MAFSLDKILNSDYLPHWLEECEIQQGTFDLSQDVLLNEILQTYTSNVFGVSNRPLAQLYAIDKIISNIIRKHHYTDGKHHIVDDDVMHNAFIRESPDINDDNINDPYLTDNRKLNLDFYGMEMPDEYPPKNYTTTRELADKIDELYEFINLLRKGLGSHIALRYTIQSLLEKELGLTGFVLDPMSLCEESSRNSFVVTKNAEVMINGRKLILKNSNNPSLDDKCLTSLSTLEKEFNNVPSADVIYLEIFFNVVTNSHFPYGNMQYGNNETITPGSTSNWLPYIANKDNNLFIDQLFNLSQLKFRISSCTFNPSTSSYGIDQIPNISKSNIRGLWKTDNSLIFPIMVVSKRNLGIYHCAMNPGGTSSQREGTMLNSISDCFNKDNVAYYHNSTPCPVYSTYDQTSDTYSYNGLTYSRSGLSISGKSSYPLGYFADIVYYDDIVTIGKQIMDHDNIIGDLTERILSNSLYTELNPVMKGLASNMINGSHYARNVVQVIGFGPNEQTLFGFDNKGSIFVDETNNEVEGITDLVRTYWGDPAYTSQHAFSFIEGQNSSESRSFLTYEPVSQVLTLNTTALSGVPFIHSSVPTLVWDDGTLVTLATNWTGLGTTSAYCIINPKQGRKVYGLVNFSYRLGSGVPFILDGTIKVLDTFGISHNFCIQKSENFCLGCSWHGSPSSGDTDHLVLPTCIDCDRPEDIIGSYVLVLNGANSGQYRRIENYDCDSRVVLFEQEFNSPITSADKVTIGKLEPGKTTIVINPFARGVTGAFKRQLIQTTGVRQFFNFPLVDCSEGTIVGTMIKDLPDNTVIEVVTRENEPLTTGFYIYTRCNPMFNQYKELSDCELKIIKPGVLIDTTKGSANSPFSLYRQFVPTFSTKVVDDTKWISTDCDNPFFRVKPIEFWDISYEIRPVENLILSSLENSITTHYFKLGDKQSVNSDIILEETNKRLAIGVTLVTINDWYFLLCSVRHLGRWGLNRGFLIDVNKIY